MNLTNEQYEALVEAYHTVYDIKDASTDTEVRHTAFQAIGRIKDLACKMGSTLPKRFDGQGRPQPERTWTFTISANFTAATEDDARDEWYDWLNSFNHVAEGTQVTENLPDADDGTPSLHLDLHLDGLFEALVEGDEGQDRESYTDDQDRDSYNLYGLWLAQVAQGDTKLGYDAWVGAYGLDDERS